MEVKLLILENGHPGIKESIRMIQYPEGGNGHEKMDMTPADYLRVSIFGADETPRNQKLLKQNYNNKLERKNLRDIQERIGSIEVSDGGGNSIDVSLDKGFKCKNQEGED